MYVRRGYYIVSSLVPFQKHLNSQPHLSVQLHDIPLKTLEEDLRVCWKKLEIMDLVSKSANPLNSAAPSGTNTNTPSRYENQKRRDWNTFCQYIRNHRPPLSLPMCNGAHVLEFLRYLDQFGKTKVHNPTCPFFGIPNPPAPCPCPLRQAWGSLDALIGRLRAAYEENGGRPDSNPFGARPIRLYLREVRDFQAKARGVSYEKKRKRPKPKIASPNATPAI